MFWLTLIIVTLLRLCVIIFLGAGDDEAYHWVWSQHLALSYYDHPPMVAYIVRVFTFIFGNNPFAVHLGALIFTTGFLLIIYRWLKEMFSPEETLWGSLLIIFVPIIFLGGAIIAPDTPLGLFWILSLYLVYKALRKQKSLYWYLAGITMGLASLSKYNGLLLPVLVFLYLCVSSTHRFWLKRKEPYIALMFVALFFSPVIIWNAQHNWASFNFQFISRQRSAFSIIKFFKFIASQIIYISPVGFILALFGFKRLLYLGFRQKKWEYQYLFFTSFPVLVFFALNSFYSSKFGPHWPVFGYIGGFFGAVAGIKFTKKYKTLLKLNLAICFLMLLTIIGQSFYPLIPFSPDTREKDFTNDFYGWDNLNQEIKKLQKSLPDNPFLLAERYQTGSQLSLATEQEVYVLKPGRKTGFDFWQNVDSIYGCDAIYFTHSRFFSAPDNLYKFDKTTLMKEIPVYRGGHKARIFYLYYCKNFQGLR